MKHKTLHDLAKFGAGLVAGDLISIWWIASHDLLPLPFLGMTFTSEMIFPAVVFDAALLLILIHYGWNIGKIPALRERSYLMIAGIIFGFVSVAHLARIFLGSEVTIMNWSLPLWMSWVGTAVTAYLSYMSFHLALRMKR